MCVRSKLPQADQIKTRNVSVYLMHFFLYTDAVSYLYHMNATDLA